jgi:hypothetical protein
MIVLMALQGVAAVAQHLTTVDLIRVGQPLDLHWAVMLAQFMGMLAVA